MCPLCRGTLFNPGLLTGFDFDDPIEEGDHVLSPAQKTIEIEESRSVVDKSTFPVRLGKFKKLNVGAEEGEGETSSSNLDARRCYSLGSYQYVVSDFNLMVDLSSEQNVYDVKLAKLRERCANLSSAEGDGEGKRIGIGMKTDSYSFSKIWLWRRRENLRVLQNAKWRIHLLIQAYHVWRKKKAIKRTFWFASLC
ncbi:hypothetical protein RND71_019724 [Anisodus tanguticus]|uniref:Uncharacterized protein n=1 Tax=Anisodus tanguticus TaxID=243964 RepID=A0AAE1V9L3_9SOLA|nr:hypothetical protein RND71_019724 [Anisodus tanguticus]